MNDARPTIKITLQTQQLIQLVADATGEKQYRVILRLLLAEAGRLGIPLEVKE